MTEVSIVIPVYNEQENVELLYKEVKSVLSTIGRDHEIIFIDDGSKDNSFSIVQQLHQKDKTVKGIKFRRNFGQTAAMDAGFKAAKGRIIIAMDADLQNDPQDIPALLSKIEEGYDCVSGWRFNRKDPFSKRFFSKIANIVRKSLTNEAIHDSGCTLKAYRKECFDDLDLYGEMHRFIPALLMWKGFKVTEIKVNHRQRKFGKTKYTLKRILRGFLDLLVVKFWMQYSTRPVHLFGGVGILIGLWGIIIGAYLIFLKLFLHQSIGNRPLLLLGVLCLILGTQFFMFGLLADIMIKNHYRQNPPYKIEKKMG